MIASFRLISFRGALLLLCGAHATQAQDRATTRAATGLGEIRGRLVDSATAQAVTVGSITIRGSADTSFAGGALPGPDGSFHVESLTPGSYTVRIRAIGFAPVARTVTVAANAPVVDLGTIRLSPFATKIADLLITAEQNDVSLAPDRNSYSTKNMTTASGGTAVDILRNVPSVEVDGSNKVSLRGNENVVVQINGRSSPLHGEQLGNFLAQLPASNIARVEVATNPSAKNDPEGTAGIINIVLDQRADLHLSGGVTASAGTTGLATISGNIGQQRGPWTLFASYSFFRDSRTVTGHRDLTNLVLADPAFVWANLNASSSPLSQNVTLRSEYRFDEHDALSVDAVILRGKFARESVSNYTDFNASRDVIGLFDQFNDQHSRNGLQDYALAFRRTGSPDASTFSAELHVTRANSNGNAELFGLVHQADSSTTAINGPRERDVTSAQYPSWSLQTDFTQPFAHAKLESGLKGTLRHTANDFTAAYLDSISGQFTLAPGRTTAFDYREQIGAGYIVLSQQLGKTQTQAGLRLEQAVTRLTLASASQTYDTRYASAFPSAVVAYNLTDKRQIKLSYSRRITRPDPFQLSPVVYREDARHSFLGNPNLRPEYTDAFEFTFQENKGWGSVQINTYVRRTAHAVRFIQRVDTTGVVVGTYDNVAAANDVGTDLNMTYRNGPLTLLTGGSAHRYQSDAANLARNISIHASWWSTRANATWKFTPVTDLQLSANYRSPYPTEGGSQTALVFMNVALRRKLWGDQGSATLRVNDPFNLLSFGYHTGDGRVNEIYTRRFARGASISISRNFGQQLKLRPRQDPEVQGPPQPGG